MIRALDYSRRRPIRQTISPADAGRLLTLKEFERAKQEPGYVYELIDGVLCVSPIAFPPHARWVRFIRQALESYAARHPSIIDFVIECSEVVVPGRPGATRPQPDIAAYHGFNKSPVAKWEDICPLIVVEVISPRRERKDTVRNRHLYWMAGGIAEYWIVDPTEDANKPVLIALSRRPGRPDWREQTIPFGSAYRSKALPKFSLNLKKASKR